MHFQFSLGENEGYLGMRYVVGLYSNRVGFADICKI